MYKTQVVLGLLTLCVGLAQSFTWDIVVARSNRLEFYNEGELVHTATPASHRIKWITYDPVHDRVLFSEKYNRDSASSFDIANKTIQSLIKKTPNRYLKRFAYDPATELLFGTVVKSIYSFPLAPGNNSEVNGDLVITLETIPREIAVDSCGGYIYWRANNVIERSLFNGSEREVIIENTSNVAIQGLAIDSQKIYWIETQEYYDGEFSIESADLDGNNKRTIYNESESDSIPDKLTISKDFITWGDNTETFFWQIPKNPPKDSDVKPNKIAMHSTISFCCSDIAANYKIEERVKRVPNCNALLNLLPEYHVCLNAFVFCVHGTKVIGESRCDCIQGYIGERCDISVCENYCLQGDCKVNVEGKPTCRCNAGYSGERCDVNACHKHCLNNGVCSLNEEDEPVCQCTEQYEGGRCDVRTTLKPVPTSDNDDTTPTGKTTRASNADVENNITFLTTTNTPTTLRLQENNESTTIKTSAVETIPTSDNDDTTPTGKTTTASNTDVENNITFFTTTNTPTTLLLQENNESTTIKTSTVETSSTSKGYDGTPTDMNQKIQITTASDTDVENNTTFTFTTITPITPRLQQNDESTTKSSVVETISGQIPNDGFHWLPLVDGKLPPNAVIGGIEDGNAIYIARANHIGSLCPGKYVNSTGIAYVPWGMREHIKEQFEILCGTNAKWVKTDYDNIPKHAFVGGSTGAPTEIPDEPLYICRATIDDRLICGKAHARTKKCYLPYKGAEKEMSSYEILVEE